VRRNIPVMTLFDSPADRAALARVRALLEPPVRRGNPLAAVAAAAFFAFSGMALAVVTITTPAVLHDRQAPASGGPATAHPGEGLDLG